MSRGCRYVKAEMVLDVQVRMGSDIEIRNECVCNTCYCSARFDTITTITDTLPFPDCLNRELKGVFGVWLGGATPFGAACGWGLPLGIREDRCAGGGICVFEALGLRRASPVPFGIALSAGD